MCRLLVSKKFLVNYYFCYVNLGIIEESVRARSTAYRNANRKRKANSDQSQKDFKKLRHHPKLVVHWNEVMLKNTTNDELKSLFVNRLPVIFCGYKIKLFRQLFHDDALHQT